jgi:amino acid transporter
LHSFLPKWGVRLSDVLGLFKLVVLLLVVLSGFVALAGKLKVEKTDNFTDAFDGSTRDAYSYVTALLNVMYSYRGWENANYVRLCCASLDATDVN